MSALDRRTLTDNIVLDMRSNALIEHRNDPKIMTAFRPNALSEADLRVDRTHPFFFDHPLDHVPGLLLLEGATQLVQSVATSSEYIASISAQFIRYALFDMPIQLSAAAAPGRDARAFDVTISQDNIVRAKISVDLAPFTHTAPSIQAKLAPAPCRAALLNKWRPENVLISEPRLTPSGLCAEILPPLSLCLLADSFFLLHPLYLLEAFMQTQRYLNGISGDAGRMRDILTGVSITQIAPNPSRQSNLHIVGAKEYARTDKRRLIRSASIFVGSVRIADCAIETARAMQAQPQPISQAMASLA